MIEMTKTRWEDMFYEYIYKSILIHTYIHIVQCIESDNLLGKNVKKRKSEKREKAKQQRTSLRRLGVRESFSFSFSFLIGGCAEVMIYHSWVWTEINVKAKAETSVYSTYQYGC